jgi:hypothetical protein
MPIAFTSTTVRGDAFPQDYSGNAYHATAVNSPVFNKRYVSLSGTEYFTLPSGFLTAFNSLTSFSSSSWVYVSSVSVPRLTSTTFRYVSQWSE